MLFWSVFTRVDIYIIITEFYVLYSIDRYRDMGIPLIGVSTGIAYKLHGSN